MRVVSKRTYVHCPVTVLTQKESDMIGRKYTVSLPIAYTKWRRRTKEKDSRGREQKEVLKSGYWVGARILYTIVR